MLNFSCFKFEELSNSKLYEILKLRSKIFVIEQKCLYQDMDALDNKAYHILIEKKNSIIGYSRVLEKGSVYKDYLSIGRVCVDEKNRGNKIGDLLIEYSLKLAKEKYKNIPIKISAQSYLKDLYKKHGFIYKGEEYIEDGIPHSAMYLE
jgi:ElaA protein|tara:strand:+ start:52234 stop:52680 length:447 start_codon:yes stop_codon:yes gene_type:complete